MYGCGGVPPCGAQVAYELFLKASEDHRKLWLHHKARRCCTIMIRHLRVGILWLGLHRTWYNKWHSTRDKLCCISLQCSRCCLSTYVLPLLIGDTQDCLYILYHVVDHFHGHHACLFQILHGATVSSARASRRVLQRRSTGCCACCAPHAGR